MSVPAPHFLLYAEAAPLPSPAFIGGRLAGAAGSCEGGRWRFVLRLPGGETSLEAADEEPEASPERLELLAVVRGLESLSQPSRVTLLTGSRHLRRGLELGLPAWRDNDWQWERYGRMSPIKNGDLWQRLDRLLEIHVVQCQPARLDKADDLIPPPRAAQRLGESTCGRTREGRTFRIDTAELQHVAGAERPRRKAAGKRQLRAWAVRDRGSMNVASALRRVLAVLASLLRSIWPCGTPQPANEITAERIHLTTRKRGRRPSARRLPSHTKE